MSLALRSASSEAGWSVLYSGTTTFAPRRRKALVTAATMIVIDRRFKIGHGRLFALYVAGYCLGRFWIELLRSDFATEFAGIRVNSFTSGFVFIGAVIYTCVCAGAPGNGAKWEIRRLSSTPRIVLQFGPDLRPGTQVWFCARWLNPRLQAGPASNPVGTHLGGGVTLPQELRLAA